MNESTVKSGQLHKFLHESSDEDMQQALKNEYS
jgi:hypothetical protein